MARAVAAARKAFDEGEWPRMSGKQRGKVRLAGRGGGRGPGRGRGRAAWGRVPTNPAAGAEQPVSDHACLPPLVCMLRPPHLPPAACRLLPMHPALAPPIPPHPCSPPPQVLTRLADLIEKHADELAAIESLVRLLALTRGPPPTRLGAGRLMGGAQG